MILFIFLALTVIQSTTAFSVSTGCSLTALNQHKVNNWPLFTMNSEFIYADKGKTVIENIPTGKTVEITCPGGKIKGVTGGESVTATCISGSQYKISGVKYDFSKINIYCTVAPVSNARYTGKLCENKGKEAKIGFTKAGGYIQQIRLCFDPKTQLALYSHYTVTKSIGQHDLSPRPRNFTQDHFYSLGNEDINNLYRQVTQRVTINRLLGLPDNDMTIIQESGEYFLSRGHFAARKEFVYDGQRNATFHFINVAPQWQIFNNGNWDVVEDNVTMIAEKQVGDLEVYTGTWDVTTLPHNKTKQPVPLYLYVNNKQRALPVPDLFWKAVYNTAAKTAVVIFGINNPYKSLADIKAHSVICTDVLPKISWLKFRDPHNISKGYMYACEFAAAKAKISYLPDWKVNGLFI